MNVSEALITLLMLCKDNGYSFSFEYDNGKRIPGEFIMLPEEEQKLHIRQDPPTYEISVSDQYYTDPDFHTTVSVGVRCLIDLLREDGHTEKANQIYHLFGGKE